jgi:outer membrane protein
MKSRSKLPSATLLAAVAAVTLGAQPALADKGDLILRGGVHAVNPKSDNSPLVNVDEGYSPSIMLTYFLSDNWAIDVLGSVPFKHDVNLNGGGKVAELKHLPPTVSLQYHFLPSGAMFRPYVGAGVNYTLIFDEKTRGALAGTNLSLDNSVGATAQLGADFVLNDKWAINIEARWIDIDTDAKLDGAALGTVEVDPLVFGVTVAYKFKL